MKNSLLLYLDSYTRTIGKLSYEQKGKLFDAIFSKAGAEHAVEPELDILLEMAFDPIANSIDRANEKYERVCVRNSKNGNKGGRPKGKPKEPSGFIGNPGEPKETQRNPSEPKKPDSDSDSDSDSEKNITTVQENAKPDKPAKDNPMACAERGGDRNRTKVNGYSEKFLAFWAAYPKKHGKAPAWKKWKREGLDSIFDEIMVSLGAHKASAGWVKNNGQFIPQGSTWVNQERWEDEIQPSTGINQSKNGVIYDL